METTRHFVATVYVVCDGATLLHDHEKLGMWLPPGGHVDRAEAPHETARRETREETGLDVTLLADDGGFDTGTVRSLPRPQEMLLEDINVCGDEVGHQHVDFVYYGRAESRQIDPAPGEAPPSAWEWYTPEQLRAAADRLEPDVVELGCDAVAAVERARSGEKEEESGKRDGAESSRL